MNCEESKNLIVEMTEADEVGSNAELSAHLAVCSTCRQFLKYELKMRDGFEEIASEPLPAEVARKILECLNRDDVAVVCSMMKIETSHYAVVRTGGFVFVELLDAE